MARRKYLILLFLVPLCLKLRAQDVSMAPADSTSKILYESGEWKQLIRFGEQAIPRGADFLLLRERIAYAYFVSGNYKGALNQYEHILTKDSYNLTARYYAYYCNINLNNDGGAAINASYLDSATLKKENIKKYALTSAALETGLKFPQNSNRGNGFYSRVGLGNRIGWHLQLEQSVAYFNQNIYSANTNPVGFGGPPGNNQMNNSDSQIEYYIKAAYAINSGLSFIGAYHYLNTAYLNTTYNSNIGLAGMRYTGNRYIDLQADVNFGNIFSSHLMQYNAQLTFYPNGNLDLYTTSRASVKNMNSQSRFIFNQALGFKVANKTWLEGNVTAGDLENYIDADGLYIYNAIDNTKFKTGATLFRQLNLHTMLQINYTYETKYDIYKAANYNQHSITAGIAWKF